VPSSRRPKELSRRAALGAAVGGAGGLLGCARSALDAGPLDALGGAGGSSGGTGGSKGGAGGHSSIDVESLPEDGTAFDLGVQAGEMTDRSVLFWTHVASGEAVELRVWREGRAAPEHRTLVVQPSAAGFVHERVTELEPATWYRYAFVVRGRMRRSSVGRVRTAPGSERGGSLLVGSLACTSFGYLPYPALELLAREPLDFFVHAGDMSYNDGARTLEDFRAKWRATLDSAGYRALLASTGAYFTWDDHEVTNDFDAEWLTATDEEFFAVAREAYFEALARRPNATGGLWQSFRWGSTAELFVLDCRGERQPSTLGSERPIFVSDAQLDWLREGLRASPSHFKIIVTSVPIGLLSEEIYAAADNRWQGYVAQREELLAFIDDRGIENVWFLSGDIHMGLVHRVDRAGRDAKLWEICSGPGGQSTHDSALFSSGDAARYERAFPTEQVVYASPNVAYTTFEFDPEASSVRVRFVDVQGETAFDRVLLP
jgi:alkaline phosphatase D